MRILALLLLALIAPFPAHAADVAALAKAASEGFTAPQACGGMTTKLGNILGVIMITRFNSLMNAEAKFTASLATARTSVAAYAAFCPTFAQNPNSPTALAQQKQLHQAAASAVGDVATQNTALVAASQLIQKKYADAMADSTCFKSVNFDVMLSPNKNTEMVNALIKAESSCGAAAK